MIYQNSFHLDGNIEVWTEDKRREAEGYQHIVLTYIMDCQKCILDCLGMTRERVEPDQRPDGANKSLQEYCIQYCQWTGQN